MTGKRVVKRQSKTVAKRKSTKVEDQRKLLFDTAARAMADISSLGKKAKLMGKTIVDKKQVVQDIILNGDVVARDENGKLTLEAECDGVLYKATWVEPSSVRVDEDAIKEAVGPELWERYCTRLVFDIDALKDAVDDGVISEDVLASNTKFVPGTAYIKITG